jgi:rhodanese-related sulfurtransferase
MKLLVSVWLIVLSVQALAQNQSATSIAKNVSVEEFGKLIASKQGVLLDVRTAAEVKKGAIENSIHIDLFADDFLAQVLKLDKNKPVYVYCASGGRSGEAMDIMSRNGFKAVYNLEGGYGVWIKIHPVK